MEAIRRRGFSLLEILLSLAIVALGSTLFIVAAESLLFGEIGHRPPPMILHNSVKEARYQAAATKEPVTLRFNSEDTTFYIMSRNGEVLERFTTGYDPRDNNISVTFRALLPTFGLNFPRSDQVDRQQLEYVTFAPDRSSVPFEVTMVYDGQTLLEVYDPFSDGVLRREER